MKKYFALIFLLATLVFTSCEPQFDNPVDPDNPEVTSGSADFSRYVAVGNSLTAGYSNGTLYKSGQENSFPKLLADRMAEAGGGNFTVPYLESDPDNIGGMKAAGQVILQPRLVIDAGEGKVERINRTPTQELVPNPGPYGNMGIPGAKIFHYVAPGYGDPANLLQGRANPYYVRIASSANASVFQDVLSQQPTFFTLWLGNNDVLSYATSGGAGTDQTGNPDPATYGPNDITDPNIFAYIYNQMLQALTSNGAKGVLMTIPDVSSIPFFTTIPYNPVPLDDATAQALNQAYAQYNGGLQLAYANGLITQEEMQKRTVQFQEGQNPVVIIDEYLTDLSGLGLPSIRQTSMNDLIVLPAASVIGRPDSNNPGMIMGVTSPLSDEWILSENEIAEVRTATAQYNAAIQAMAQNYDLAVADMAARMEDLIAGLRLDDNSIYTADYFSGITTLPNLFFSLDGVHPNRKGYVILANEIIDAINEKYGASLRKYDPGYFDADILILPSN